MSLTDRCKRHLQGVHPDLARVAEIASSKCKFRVTEGLRSIERQRELVASKKSKTLNSRHLTGHAFDVIAIGEDGIATYDMADMARVAKAIREAAKEANVPIEWGAAAKYGGDFKSFNDTPHFQLPWKTHPAQGISLKDKVLEAVQKPTVAIPSAGGAGVAIPQLPPAPDVSKVADWQGSMETVTAFMKYLATNPVLAIGFVAFVAFVFVAPRYERES